MMPCTAQVTDLAAISNLPKALREPAWRANFRSGCLAIERRYDSADGTRRYLLRLADGKTVETVWMPEGERSTICISSQVGCPVDCKFCLTALMGLERNLTAGEIVGQVLRVAADNALEANADRVNIVMMGQGEPLLNLANVIKATRLLTDPDGHGDFAAPDHAFDLRDHSEDRRTGARAGAAEAGDFAERIDRRTAAGADADHAQVSS